MGAREELIRRMMEQRNSYGDPTSQYGNADVVLGGGYPGYQDRFSPNPHSYQNFRQGLSEDMEDFEYESNARQLINQDELSRIATADGQPFNLGQELSDYPNAEMAPVSMGNMTARGVPTEMPSYQGPDYGDAEGLQVSGMQDMTARGTALAQENWLNHHKPENYDNAEEFKQQMYADGVVNPLYGNQTAEKLRGIYGGDIEPAQNDVVGRGMHAAATKKREINKEAFEKVLARFGGEMSAYNDWWHKQPEDERPTDYTQALQATAHMDTAGGASPEFTEKDWADFTRHEKERNEGMYGASDEGYYSGMSDEGMFDPSSAWLQEGPMFSQEERDAFAEAGGERGTEMVGQQPSMDDAMPPAQQQAAGETVSRPRYSRGKQARRRKKHEAFLAERDKGNAMAGAPATQEVAPVPDIPSDAGYYSGMDAEGRYDVDPIGVGMPTLDQIVMGDREAAQNEQDIGDIMGSVRFADEETSGVPYQEQWDLLRDQGSVHDYPTLRNLGIEKFPTVGMPTIDQIQVGGPPGQGNEYDTMSMAPSDMMSQYADPAVDAAPNGLFSEETRTMSEIQSQVLTAQSSDANTNDSMGEKKVRKRRRSRGKQAYRRGQEEAAMDRLIRGSGMEFGPMAVDPSMQFGPSVELGQPTIYEQNYDRRLGFNPLPPLQPESAKRPAWQYHLDRMLNKAGGGL